jgi:hypothetical protein
VQNGFQQGKSKGRKQQPLPPVPEKIVKTPVFGVFTRHLKINKKYIINRLQDKLKEIFIALVVNRTPRKTSILRPKRAILGNLERKEGLIRPA